MVPPIRTRRQGSCHASAEQFQQCAEFVPLRNRGLGPLAVPVLPIPLARRGTATACATVQSTAALFRRWRPACTFLPHRRPADLMNLRCAARAPTNGDRKLQGRLQRRLSYYARSGMTALRASFFSMSSDRVIVDAIKVAQDLLRQNLPPAHHLTDAAAVLRFRELVRSQAVRSALDRSSDTLLAFALREVERVLCDHSRPHRETINQLWGLLDDPHLNKALGIPHNSRMTFGQYPKRR